MYQHGKLWVPASELKDIYQVSGHFYALPDTPYNYRSCLEIATDKAQEKPDAIVVMMNPGSSRPRTSDPEKIENIFQLGKSKQLVEARPDNTQYQIMRLMRGIGWDRVRVINLSDVSMARSECFYRYVDEQTEQGYWDHSIFSDRRKSELQSAVVRKDKAPIICAWGVSTKLKVLINMAMQQIEHPIGYRRDDGSFYHPFGRSMQETWLDGIYEMVRPNCHLVKPEP